MGKIMGQIKIIDRDWVRDTTFWFALDGPVTIEIVPTEMEESDTISEQYWRIQKLNDGTDNWALQTSNTSKTNNHTGSCLNKYPDTPEEVFCRFTTQIVDYQKPVSFSPHSETLKWEREKR